MNIATAKEQIKDTVEAYLQKDDAGMYVINPSRQRPMFLVGAPGIGKTAIIEQIAQELEIGVVSYSMTHHTRQSALGLPRIVHREFEGFEYEASEYTMSEIVSAVYDYMERTGLDRGILFLDEINCVSETLYPSMLQFLQFKTFGRHRVPEDWIIVCAGNPPEYNKSVHEFDIVTLDRLREIDVEPDYAAFKRYASEKGIHPAVTTFLEAKPDCFYKVEAKPGGGKSFVTARGWEDLAEVITLYEQLGKPCNRELFVQFLRDDDIADRFSVYYSLFDKYRSDYQISRILVGDVSAEIETRAKNAEFDERVALLGLVLDALSAQCASALDQEGVVIELRDMLREAKPKLLEGGSVEDAVVVPMRKREAALARKVAAGTAKQAYQRKERLVLAALKDIVAKCSFERTEEGPTAFATVNAAYREQVDGIQPLVDKADSSMTNAFRFIEGCFGNSREMLVFMAELSTRAATTQFIAHYGNDRYYAHNDELQVDVSRKNLSDRVRELTDLENADAPVSLAESLTVDMGGSAGLSRAASAVPVAK
ncbi:MAG: AAA family ATPase, partial [Eggerthellaceae bacterium]|nr:AAA family ATPase [Eggerthellaceae bacterium]